MTTLTNTCEGTSGVAVSTSNNAGPDQFSNFIITGTGTTLAYSNAQASRGSTSILSHLAAVSSSSYVVWTWTAGANAYARIYFRASAYPSVNARIISFLLSSTSRAGVLLLTSGALRIVNSSGTNVGTTLNPIPTGQWVRIEFDLTNLLGTTGNAAVRFYSGANLHTNTPDSNGTATATSLATGGATVDTVRIGGAASTVTQTTAWDAYLDDLAVSDTTQPGPVAAGGTVIVPSMVATATESAPTVESEYAVSGGGPFAGSGLMLPPSVNAVSAATVTAAVARGTARLPYAGIGFVETPALTATPDLTNSPPRVILQVSAAPGEKVTVYRVDAAGNRKAVRGANPGTLSAGAWLGYDYEAPYNRSVSYEATTDASTATTPLTTSVVLSATRTWLIHPSIPSLSVPLNLMDVGSRTYAAKAGVFRPLGRSDAVVISDGQRQDATFEVKAWTDNEDDETRLDNLLSDESVLLLQIAHARATRTRYAWVAVGDATQDDIGSWVNDEYVTTWTLPCTVAAAPSGYLVSQRTLADLYAEYATLGDLADNFATLRDIATNTPIGT